jgi:peptidyl-prolyl cis-trans isomerase D
VLQKLRDQTQSLFFKIIVGILVFVLAVFGFGAFNLFTTGEPEVASVNGEPITQNQLIVETERERVRRLSQMGQNVDPAAIDPARLQTEVLEQLITRQLLAQAADDMKVGVSRERVDEMILNQAEFQVDGSFNADLYRNTLQMLRYTPSEFMDQTRLLLGLDQMQRSLVSTSLIADWEMRLYNRLLNQNRDLAYLPFTREDFIDQVEVTDEDVDLHYQENELLYMTEEAVDVQYVELRLGDLLDNPSLEVSEEELLAVFDSLSRDAGQTEERTSSHILLRIEENETAEEVIAEVQAIKDRILAGEAFEDLAQTLSEDPGSAAAGGLIGTFGRGSFDPAFEDALFALETGQLSDPVQTEFGIHLIRLDGIELTDPPSFEEMRAELEQDALRAAAQALFDERADDIDALAFEDNTSLEQINIEYGLELKQAPGVTRVSGPALFVNSGLRLAIFDPEVLELGNNTEAFRLDDETVVVARVQKRYEPTLMPLEEVADQIRDVLRNERADELIRDAQTQALADVQAGEPVSEVANRYGVRWVTFELVRRTSPGVPAPVAQVAFELPKPDEGAKVVGEAALGNGGRAVVTVTRVVDGEISAVADTDLDALNRFLENHRARMDFAAIYESLEQDASIRR